MSDSAASTTAMAKQRPMTPPASNSAELQQSSFSHLAQFNANNCFSQDSPAQYDVRGQYLGTPQSGFPTPSPVYQEDLYSAQQPEYVYSQQGIGLGLPDNVYESTQYGVNQYSAQNTPQMYAEQFDYAPSPTPSDGGVIKTRSGLSVHRPLRPSVESRSKTTKPNKGLKQKKPKVKAAKKTSRLTEPLSVLTKDWNHVPVADIEAYVNRSAEIRRREVDEGKQPGKVKRPMNSFMLYRKAYQNRTKDFCLQNNHQVVSQVCGDSWPLEPEEIREQFNEWSRVERANHQNAHPGYKFSPSKPGQSKKDLKRKASETPELSEESDLDDWDYTAGRQMKKPKRFGRKAPVDPDDAYHLTGQPYQYNSRESSAEPSMHYNPSSYQATNPGKPLPSQYSAHLHPDHYYQQQVVQGPFPGTEDVRYSLNGTPGPQYIETLPQTYGNAAQYSQQHMPHASPRMIDPALFGQDGTYNSYPYPMQNIGYIDNGTLNPGHLHNNTIYTDTAPQYGAQAGQLLKNEQDQWQVSSIDPEADFEEFWKNE